LNPIVTGFRRDPGRAKHIVNQKSGRFEPEKFEDQYEAALVDLINKKRAGQPITKKDRPSGGNVVDLMEALRRNVGGAQPAKASKPSKKPRKAASGQKEMLMPITGKKAGKEAAARKSVSKPQRKSA
jgi:DNA end-binding protein Ku